MDRIIEVKVYGNHLSKDSNDAGVRGEANVTQLRITFDEGWYDYTKKITFWDARGLNPVTIVLLPKLAETENTYLVPIPAEPMAEAGMLTFVIQGTVDDKVQRSLSDKLKVKDAPIPKTDNTPVPPTEDELTQIEGQIEAVKSDILTVRNAKEDTQKSAETAIEKAEIAVTASKQAEEDAIKAQEAVGKTSYVGDNGNWYAWDSKTSAFYDTGIKAQAGSTVYVGDNPPDDADVWIDPDGNGGVDITTIEDLINEVSYAKSIADEAHGQSQSNSTGIEWLTGQVENLNSDCSTLHHIAEEARNVAEGNYQHIMNLMDTHASDIEGIRKDINEQSHFRGYFWFNVQIRAMAATPNDFAYSAESGTVWVYDAQSGWQNTGTGVPDQLTPASNTTPLMNGTASVGTENGYARGDHRHPTDITRASVAEVNELKSTIETALDHIIDIQNNLMGVSE